MASGEHGDRGRDVLTLDEVADYLQLGKRSVYRLVNSGELPGRKVLGRWRFHVRDVENWLRATPVGSRDVDVGARP
ncbi:MAG: helix-turn-helix domain-containing protein [Polyangiaceae bacterium]